ncbi:MAG: bifunctional nuclease family protein [Gemmataceae bacterium]
MRQRQFAGETHLCQECALNYLPKPRPNHRRQDPVPRVGDVQIEVERLIISEIHDLHTIVFREVEGERRFPLSCGFFEATALDRTLKSLSFPRPLTHEAWQASLTALGAIVEQARIKDLRDGIYFVDLRIRHGNKQVQVDMRPSDAVHIAWKANAPIFINDSLLSEAAGDQSIPA